MLNMALFDCAIMENVAVLTEDGAFGLFFQPHRGDLTAQESPPPGICHPTQKKGVSPGEGWAQVELTDALYFEHYAKVPIIIFQTWATCACT